MPAIFAPVSLVGADSFRRVTEVTYLGYVFGTQCALRKMLPRDAGTIVQVGSALAYRGIPLQAAYCAAKHAILGFHESLRCELLPTGSKVAVTMVQLPSVNTPLYDWLPAEAGRQPRPVPPAYHPDVAARGILHAADHPRRREYWVGGQSLATILATKAAPAVVDRVLVAAGYWLASSSKPHPALPSNLWAAADDDQDRGVKGHCVSYTRRFSMQLWASHHRVPVAAIGALAAWALVRRLASAHARSLKARACQRLALRER
ncbi:SDR family oxidoreductase [Streptomyces diacarni]|uniref:SDR family oxidoreductase n=1 Tax=Streptomyces diacarni TaxID=2800381 RepID=UPI001FE5A592|nr:SDR family oxidoreductase [Streptomyces diacarni]